VQLEIVRSCRLSTMCGRSMLHSRRCDELGRKCVTHMRTFDSLQ
jgi:hypothetical protein